MARRRRPKSEKQFAAEAKFAAETLVLGRKLLVLRARLRRFKRRQEEGFVLTAAERVQARETMDKIASTKEKLVRRGIPAQMLNNGEAFKAAIDAAKVRPTVPKPTSGGVGVYAIGQARKIWK
jgi:hypothetical protein